jgi:TRAP-type C4-dicarboxylate transport system permease large subunit
MRSIIWGTLPFIFIMVFGIALLSWFPEIALWLPGRMMAPGR